MFHYPFYSCDPGDDSVGGFYKISENNEPCEGAPVMQVQT